MNVIALVVSLAIDDFTNLASLPLENKKFGQNLELYMLLNLFNEGQLSQTSVRVTEGNNPKNLD